jgi:glyoxylase-like metal-dependent hydrolase (beta-lactamase superfamily II)
MKFEVLMTEKIRDNLYRIPVVLPNTSLRELNSYVIVGGKRSLLIDTGFDLPVCMEAMSAGLKELGLRAEDMDIFLTHRHPDHVGLVERVTGPDTRVYISRIDARRESLLGGARTTEELYQTLLRFGVPEESSRTLAKMRSVLRTDAFKASPHLVLLEDGDRIEAGDFSFTCILTPGHTPGHMCLWEEKEKILFSGDHVLFDITPNIEAWVTPCDVLDNYANSLWKIDTLDPKIVLPGHRKPGELHSRVREIIQHHDDRLLECLRVILDHDYTAYQIASHLRWKFREKEWDKAPLIQQWFATGECIAHIGYLMEKDNVAMRLSDDGVYHYYCHTVQ